jgi:hypothetical protein
MNQITNELISERILNEDEEQWLNRRPLYKAPFLNDNGYILDNLHNIECILHPIEEEMLLFIQFHLKRQFELDRNIEDNSILKYLLTYIDDPKMDELFIVTFIWPRPIIYSHYYSQSWKESLYLFKEQGIGLNDNTAVNNFIMECAGDWRECRICIPRFKLIHDLLTDNIISYIVHYYDTRFKIAVRESIRHIDFNIISPK